MDNYLVHHGVLGMKWGVRRYQNEDGSLTSEGLKRYGTKSHYESKKEYTQAKKSYNKAFNDAYKHRLSAYSLNKNRRDAETKRWESVYDAASNLKKSKDRYKSERLAAKPIIKENNRITKEQVTKALKIGAAVVGTAAVAYGAYKIGSKAIKRHELSGRIAARRALSESVRNTEVSTFFGGEVGSANRITDFTNGVREVFNYDGKTGKSYTFSYNY